jgi:hypothetical protein
MPYHNVHLRVYDYTTNREKNLPIKAETVAGLWVHHNYDGPGWAVSTRGGLALFGEQVYGTHALQTRQQARRIATYLGSLLPEEVKRGDWTGQDWGVHDASALELFEEATRSAWTRIYS